MTQPWDPDFLACSPMFEPLRIHAAAAFPARWPELADLQQLLERRSPPARAASGMPLKVVAQGRKPAALEDRYEARIYLKGELQMRARNWHDLFNVLVWLAFPRSKAALNARHDAALAAQSTANRGPAQDALTLFDEGGVIVASSDADLLTLLERFRWKELFWDNRRRVRERMRFYLFGHALYEKALRPLVGVSGRGILLEVGPELLQAPLAQQLAGLDVRVAAHIAEAGRLATTRELAPVPILGVPGWCADNERESYYDNLDYFRPGRIQGTKK